MHPPDKENAATHGGNQRTADRNIKQVESYQIYIPAQVKRGKSGRPAMAVHVVVLRAKRVHRDNGGVS